MLLFILLLLLPFATTDNVECVTVKDAEQLQRRLKMIEDTFEKERLLRRMDVQSVLDKLSELHNTLNENYDTRHLDNAPKEFRDIPGNKKDKRALRQMIKAAEKRINERIRREIQDELRKQSNVCLSMSEFKSKVIGKLDSFEQHNVGVEKLSVLLTKNIETCRNFETKIDLSTFDHNITDKQNRINEKDICTDNKSSGQDELKVLKEPLAKNEKEFGKKPEYRSCVDLYNDGFTDNGVYKIKVNERVIDVYCDQKTDGGGWIVFQRRQDGSVDFNRTWQEYKVGFGNLEGELWLGNENLAVLTANGCHELRVDIGDVHGNTKYAKYGKFKVLSEKSLYELNVGRYSGNAGDSLGYHNKMNFSTNDSDNDFQPMINCARFSAGGWWFNNCFRAYLNGVYNAGGFMRGQSRIAWHEWKIYTSDRTSFRKGIISFTFSEMKFRPA